MVILGFELFRFENDGKETVYGSKERDGVVLEGCTGS
jgi:hypothetical protein